MAVHGPPAGCTVQVPATQVLGAVQSVLCVPVEQVLTQAPAEQWPGVQAMLAGTEQLPAPLHAPAGTLENPSALHPAAAQDVPEPTFAHMPPAAHKPVLVMQTGVAAAVEHIASAVPAVTAEQVPS